MNPLKELSKFEWGLWVSSICGIALTYFICGKIQISVLCALLIGATALIFVSKGHPLGQLLTLVFACFYAYISFKFEYWGEMITYMGMTAPIALAALISWIKHPARKGQPEVKVHTIRKKEILVLLLLTMILTAVFYMILRLLNTPNLFWGTISIATSFLAASLTFLRSPYYALAYAANDIVLIILWILASLKDVTYIPMIVCFIIFLINDGYGFFNWKKMKKRQGKDCNSDTTMIK